MDYQAKLLELEALRREVNGRNEIARSMADHFFELFVLPYQEEIAANDEKVSALEKEITQAAREDALDGDFHVHTHITIKRKPAEWEYDEAAVIKGAVENNEPDLIRIKTELNKVPFKQGLANGKFEWAKAVQKPADVIITIAPLGDLPIIEKHAKLALETEG